MRKIILTAWIACSALPLAQAQSVYKWVDAQGKVNYGEQPPPSQAESKEVKLYANSSTEGEGAPAKKKIPKETQEFADAAAKELGKVKPSSAPLSCANAVSNIVSQVDTMLEVGKKNVKGGYIDSAEYEKGAAKLRAARSEVSVADCQSATGNKKSFYKCMSSDMNHVSGCSKSYPY